MATSNFPAVNSAKYYVFELEDEVLFLLELHGIAKMTKKIGFDVVYNQGLKFAEKCIDLTFGGCTVATAKISAVAYSGYYSGACLDWTAEIVDSYGAVYDLDEISLPAEDEIKFGWGAGLAKIHTKRTAENWAAKIKVETDKLEEIFSRVATSSLVRCGVMSNGEAVCIPA